ncbi:carboxypeptidase-like regulatory domain-containing protein [Hyunsoonleella sp. 2307UL5-6]|uniref:carboxypeptidase-like regulatory domain-containing protein n=1 Tax=Hyunsoonleella sp. 2307UL5-6 TaxID=3384768 RepID=UPI0039BD2184
MNNQANGRGHNIYQLGFFIPPVYNGLHTYVGKVMDASTNKPLSAAHVYYIKNGDEMGVITNQKGEFTLLAEPNDLVIISFLGFETIEARASELNQIEYMQPKYEQLNEVNITNKKGDPKNNTILYLGLGVLGIVLGYSLVDSKNNKSV